MGQSRIWRMNFLSRLALACCGVGLAGADALAARPFMTDDARITTAESCQLESWTRRYRDRTENWALPACNPTGNFEITAGGGHFHADGLPHSSDQVLQGKTLLRDLTTNDWGWGLAFGVVRHVGTQPGPNQFGAQYAYAPFSVSMFDDRVVVHTNLGWTRENRTHRNLATWGVGVEYWMHPRLMLIAEAFGDNRQKPFVQTGLRFSLIPGLLQIDATRGAQPNGIGQTTWTSFGLRYTPDRLF